MCDVPFFKGFRLTGPIAIAVIAWVRSIAFAILAVGMCVVSQSLDFETTHISGKREH